MPSHTFDSYSPRSLGDLNGDGFPDFFTEHYDEGALVAIVNSGRTLSAMLTLSLPNYAPTDATDMGDIDGDGYDDFAIAWCDGGNMSIVEVRSGLNGVVIWSFGPFPNVFTNLGRLSDIDGDGRNDLLLTNCSPSSATVGSIAIRSGVSGLVLGATLGNIGLLTQGARCDSFGDVNFDGIDDFFVRDSYGHLSLWSGADRAFIGSFPGVVSSADPCGDVNHDGIQDMLVGERDFNPSPPFSPAGTGRVSIISGADQATVLWAMLGDSPGSRLGDQVCALDDLDGDGVDEIAVKDRNNFSIIFPTGPNFAERIRVLSSASSSALFTRFGSPGFGGVPTTTLNMAVEALSDITRTGKDSLALYECCSDHLSIVSPVYLGSGEDLSIYTGINGAPSAEFPIKFGHPGDFLIVKLDTPGGSLLFAPPVVAAQVFSTGSPLNSPTGYPEIHINPSNVNQAVNPVFVIYDPFQPFIGAGVLPPGGLTFAFQVSPGLQGVSALFQGFAFQTSAQNGILAATNGHEVRF